nr:M48 family metalloprotease [Candidatus Hamiltonella defensa]
MASVLAHEISHIIQRHLARAIKNNQRLSQLTLIRKLESLLLLLVQPKAVMMAWSSSLALAQKDILSLSQSNEQEADRIRLKLLQASGFNAHTMTDFLEKLADESSLRHKPTEMLLTHPFQKVCLLIFIIVPTKYPGTLWFLRRIIFSQNCVYMACLN